MWRYFGFSHIFVPTQSTVLDDGRQTTDDRPPCPTFPFRLQLEGALKRHVYNRLIHTHLPLCSQLPPQKGGESPNSIGSNRAQPCPNVPPLPSKTLGGHFYCFHSTIHEQIWTLWTISGARWATRRPKIGPFLRSKQPKTWQKPRIRGSYMNQNGPNMPPK